MQQDNSTTDPIPLAYSPPEVSRIKPYWGWSIMAVIGLGLIFFGGCFCIGMLAMVSGPTPGAPYTKSGYIFAFGFITLAALACFASGALVLVHTLKLIVAELRR
jgi:hypothetical protein